MTLLSALAPSMMPTDLGIKPAFDQVVDERPRDGGILGCSFDQGERMFVAFPINAEGRDQHQVVACATRRSERRTPSTRPAVLPIVPRTGARPLTSKCRRRQ